MNSGPRAGAQASQSSQARLVVEKSLNAVFNWNGHSWDAYEILGVPAGSSAEAVDQAFREACTKADAESLPFLEAARAAIQRS
jgi:preprotein translocase subunit Sec63